MHDFKYNHVQVPKHAMIINNRKNTTNMGSVNLAVLIVGETVDEYFAWIWRQFFEQSGILLNVKIGSI